MVLIWFFVLSFAFTWALLPWAKYSIAVSLIALCGPAVAARVVTLLGSRESRRDLSARMNDWRLPPRWYLLALLLPVAISRLASEFEYFMGARGPIDVPGAAHA